MLIAHLVTCIPTTIAARLLNAAKFLPVLDQTLGEAVAVETLPEQVVGASTSDPPLPGVHHPQENASADVSVSSATIDISPTPTSKKRKRAGTPTDAVNASQAPSKRGLRSRDLILSIVEAVRNIVRRANVDDASDETVQAQYSREYMRSVLRSEPTVAASILGKFTALFPNMLHADAGSSVFLQRRLLGDFEPLLEIWNSRSSVSDDVDGKISNVSSSYEVTWEALLRKGLWQAGAGSVLILYHSH